MKRRFLLARALVTDPDLLILDEPTAGVDVQLRRELWTIMGRMNDEGTTILLTTHYIEEAEQLCDRVAIVDDGTIAAIDSPAALTASLGGDVVQLTVNGQLGDLETQLETSDWISEWTRSDADFRVTLDHADARIADLVHLADTAGVSIEAVDIHRPNLETVFLSLTGTTIKERESGGHSELERSANPAGSPTTEGPGVSFGRRSNAEDDE